MWHGWRLLCGCNLITDIIYHYLDPRVRLEVTEHERAEIRKNSLCPQAEGAQNHVREKLISFAILALILLIVAAFARKLCPYDPDIQDLLQAQKPPSAEHILGTDRYGRDLFSRVLVGSTISILMRRFFW